MACVESLNAGADLPRSVPPSGARSASAACAALYAIALAARLAAAILMPQDADDSARYVAEARSLLQRGVFSAVDGPEAGPTTADCPVYPALLALAMTLCGGGALALRLPGVVLGAAAAPLAWALGRELGLRHRGALAAGLAVAVWPSLLGCAALVLTESAYTAILTGAMLLYVRLWRTLAATPAGEGRAGPGGIAAKAALAGVALALAALTRPIAVAFLPLGAAGALGRSWRQSGQRAGLLAACVFSASFLAAVSPWTARNYAATGSFILLTDRAPLQLWMGSYAPSEGRHTDESCLAITRRVEGLPPAERARVLKSEAVARIRANPARWALWGARKVLTVWLGLPGGERLLRGRPLAAAAVWLPDVAAVALALAAIVMSMLGRSAVGTGAIALYPASESAVYFALLGLARFRVPMMPLVIVLAAVGMAAFARLLPSRRAGEAGGHAMAETPGSSP